MRDQAVVRRCRAPGSARRSRARDVVGRQHRGRRSPGVRPVGAHQPDVGPRDRQDAGRAARRRADRADARRAGPASGCSGWLGRYGARCARTADRADARAAAAVRDAERLVQVEVRDVAAELARAGRSPTQRVEVGAVDVDLAAGVVHERAELGDGVLVDAVRRRVGDHDRGEVVGVLRRSWRAGRRGRRCRRSSQATTTTRMPAITAEAALVPCALTTGSGRRRARSSPLARW